MEVKDVKRAYNGDFLRDNQSGEIIGISLGGDYYAEHEQPIIQLRWLFGVDSNKLGIERFTATKFPRPLVKTGTVNRQPAMLIYLSARRMSKYEQEIQEGANCKKIAGDLGLLGWGANEDFIAAWDSESFGVLVRGQEQVAHMQDVLKLWDDQEICVIHSNGNGPFGASGLSFIRCSAFSESEKQALLDRDLNALRLRKAAEKTGIAKKLKKAGLGWYALEPEWTDFFKEPKYESKYEVIFFLNPQSQDKYNCGWFTVEDLLQWIKGKGPIVKDHS